MALVVPFLVDGLFWLANPLGQWANPKQQTAAGQRETVST